LSLFDSVFRIFTSGHFRLVLLCFVPKTSNRSNYIVCPNPRIFFRQFFLSAHKLKLSFANIFGRLYNASIVRRTRKSFLVNIFVYIRRHTFDPQHTVLGYPPTRKIIAIIDPLYFLEKFVLFTENSPSPRPCVFLLALASGQQRMSGY
jgi:hypothetical protein